MGKGNICVSEANGGCFYIDYDNLNVYESKDGTVEYVLQKDIENINDYNFLEVETERNIEDFKANFIADFCKEYKTFEEISKIHDATIMRSALFDIKLEDNEWSIAIMLVPIEQEYNQPGNYIMMQQRLAPIYLKGIQKCLFKQFDTIGTYGGPWTSGRLTKEEFESSLVAKAN